MPLNRRVRAGRTSKCAAFLPYAAAGSVLLTLVERLVTDGLISRRADPSDRRTAYISLTPEGRRAFAAMARAHEQWIAELFADLDAEDVARLMRLLDKTKLSVGRASDGGKR